MLKETLWEIGGAVVVAIIIVIIVLFINGNLSSTISTYYNKITDLDVDVIQFGQMIDLNSFQQ